MKRSTAPIQGATALALARERMAARQATPAPAPAPMPATLAEVRAEQSTLFQRQRGGGLNPREFARLTELGRLELKLIAEKRENGKRLIGAPHKRR